MVRPAQLDVSSWFRRPAMRLAARLILGAACGFGMIAVRAFIDGWAPGTGPFSLVFPAVLLATLYGRWEAGLIAYSISFAWVWTQVLPMTDVLAAPTPVQIARIGINASAAAIVLVFAETFRRRVEIARQQREAEIERRAVLLAELEHRTKNNFALVASLLELQKRREGSETVRRAFDDAIGRVRTFAEAYTHLAGEQGEGVIVEMRPYLDRLVARVSSALLPPQVTVSTAFAEASLPRETAVAIGLFTNEALTNCAKYAYPDGRAGVVRLAFAVDGADWRLTVEDDGIGEVAAHEPQSGGIGTQLLGAFARQARARHETCYGESGCRVSLTYAADAG